jgi:hypothetical protein
MKFCLKLCAVVWVLGALLMWVLIGSAVPGHQITQAGGLTELFAYSLPGIIFSIPAILITWLAVGLWSRATTPPFRR